MLVSVLAIVAVVAALVYRFGKPYYRKRQARNSASWLDTEATVQSGKMELVERVGHFRERVPFFDFSYVVNSEYYSGRFGLRVDEDRGNRLIREWIGAKVNVRYDPERPTTFCLADDLLVDGFRTDTVPEAELASEH